MHFEPATFGDISILSGFHILADYESRPRMGVAGAMGQAMLPRRLPRAQVALAWLLSKPVVTAPIVGVTKPHHLEDALSALGVKLSNEEIRQLEAPYVPHPVAGF